MLREDIDICNKSQYNKCNVHGNNKDQLDNNERKLRDIEYVMFRTNRSWADSLHSLMAHKWDVTPAIMHIDNI